MTVSQVRPGLLYAWKGPSLLIVTDRGACGADESLSGFYFREARFLRRLRLTVNDEAPWLCESAAVSPDVLSFAYVYPELQTPGGGGTGQSGDEEERNKDGIPARALNISVTYQPDVTGLRIDLTIANRSRSDVHIRAAWTLDADFADIQEAQSGRREQTADVTTRADAGCLEFAYTHPALPYRTRIEHPGDWMANGAGVGATMTLASGQTRHASLHVLPLTNTEDISPEAARAREAALHAWRQAFTRVEVPGNRLLERVIAGNIRDFASFPLLDGPEDEWLAMQAGVPLYPAFFGRDAVTAGWQAACVDRAESLDAALTRLGRLQSDRFDGWRDEEPGRIPYQVRSGPLARLNINPYAAYYADYASPLMFVISLANLWAWTGDRARIARHWDAARRILDWAREHGDMDGDGYLEYRTRSSKGTKNQGWKDSGDAIIDHDGKPVAPPIAACELQGYWYLAQELMALLAAVMDARGDSSGHLKSAVQLKERFNRDFWMDDERFFALALGPEKEQVRAVTSNVGHCLACGIIDRAHLPAVVGRMFEPDLFGGWGIRTLSSTHAYYDPLSYHRGSVWGVEQATIAFGLRRFGFDARALDLAEALFDLALLYPEFRIPECVGGYARGERATPAAYPRANAPQLWNATAFPLVLQTLLGVLPLAAAHLLLVDPVLPSWMPELTLHNLRVGSARATLRFSRSADGGTDWELLEKTGTLHVVRQPPPESFSTAWMTRAGALLGSVFR